MIRARREHTYEIDTATLLLANDQWIPVEGVHELPFVQALVDAGRHFVKPLRYDARCAAAFANALLLDTGAVTQPLHVISPFMTPREREAKATTLRAGGGGWVWSTDEPMPVLPPAAPRRT